jgi:hypothetical protein
LGLGLRCARGGCARGGRRGRCRRRHRGGCHGCSGEEMHPIPIRIDTHPNKIWYLPSH